MPRAAGPVAPARPLVSLHQPSGTAIQAFLDRQRLQPFPYSGVGSSRHVPPTGYVVDHRRVCLGTGQRTFEAACAALQRWQMFQVEWGQLCWPTAGIEPDAVVGILASWGGLWFLNACRIVYVLDDISPVRRFGFAYGTLPGHAERGEERFSIEWHSNDTVWYDLLAFSRPGHWLLWLGYPCVRLLQRRFALDSLAAMVRAVGAPSGCP
jgi:uncharacterized protein (UPF0548 family)